jgi:hypothetical protein
VTRSIGRTNRLVRLAAATAALVSLGLASACSAGQLAETSRIVPAVPGGSTTVSVPNAQDPNSQILIQDATIVYSSKGYSPGDSAPLSMRVFNQTDSAITLAPGSVTLQSPQSGGKTTEVGKLTWASGAGASPAPAASDLASAPASAAPSDSASPSAAPSASASVPSAPPLTIPSGGFVILDPQQEQYLAITDLAQPTILTSPTLTSGSVVNVGLTFTANGQAYSATVPATFAPPATAPSRQAASPASTS